jgi:hypothetical protein
MNIFTLHEMHKYQVNLKKESIYFVLLPEVNNDIVRAHQI